MDVDNGEKGVYNSKVLNIVSNLINYTGLKMVLMS